MKLRWLLILLLCLLVTGCSASTSGSSLISGAEGTGVYSAVLSPFLPDYLLQTQEDTLYAEVSRGNVVACFDVQAIPAIERGCWTILVSSCFNCCGTGSGSHPDGCGHYRLE